MEEKSKELSERLLDYGVEIVKLTMKLKEQCLDKVLDETKQLSNIIARSIITAKGENNFVP